MAFDAGSVYATLGGRFSPSGFNAFGSAMYRAKADMERGEKAMVASQGRVARAARATGTAAKYAAVGGLGVLAYGLAKSVSLAADFEQQMDAVGAAANANAREMRQLRRAAMEAGAGTKFSALEAAAAQEELAKGGMKTATILKGGLRGALALAAAGNIELADAANTTVKTLATFNLSGDRAVHVADALASAANKTSMDVGDFAQAFAQGGAAAEAAGFSFDDTVNVMAAMADRFSSGSDMGTSLKTTLTQLSKPTDDAKQKMKELGIEVFDAHGRMRSVKDITGDLGRAFSGMSDKERLATASLLAGTDGMRTLLALSKERAGNIIREGAAMDVAAKKQDNFRGKLETFQGAVETAGIAIGSELLPQLTEWTEQGSRALDAWIAGGGARDFGAGVADALEELVQVAGDVIDVGGDVVGVITSIGNALGLSDVESFAAIGAAILSWKVAGSVAGGVVTLASAVGRLGAAQKALAAGQGVSAAAGLLGGAGGAAGGLGAGAAAGGAAGLATGLSRAAVAAARFVGPGAAVAAALIAIDKALPDIRTVGDAQEVLDKAADASDDAAGAFVKLRGEGSAVGSQFAHTRLDVEAAKDALEGLTPGTEQYARAQLNLRDAQRAAAAAGQNWTTVSEGQRNAASLQVGAAGAEAKAMLELADVYRERGRESRNAEVEAYFAARAAELEADAWRKVQAAQNRSAAVTANLARQYRGMTQLVGQAEQAVGALARQGQGDLAQKISLQYEAPKDVGRVAAQASAALRAGIAPKIVTRVVAETASARSAIVAMRALMAGVPKQRVFEIIGQTKDARVQVAALKATIAGVPKSTVARILENGSVPSKVKVAALTAAIRGVPASKISQITENGSLSSKEKVDALNASINAVQSRSATITITTINRTINEVINKVGKLFASGRGPGAAETAIVGEGSRWQGAREAIVNPDAGTFAIVDRPTVWPLAGADYVIPLEENRGVAAGLLRSLASDLGIPGFARGRKAKKRAARRGRTKPKRRIPPEIAQGGIPFDDVQRRYESARDSYDRAVDETRDRSRSVGGAKDALRKAERDLDQARRSGTKDRKTGRWSNEITRENAADRVKEAEKKLKTAKRDLDRSKRTRDERKPSRDRYRDYFKAAQKTDRQIKNLQGDVNIARQAMDDADRIDDQAGFDKAKSARTKKLRELIRMLQRAFGLASRAAPNTDHWRALRETLAQLGGDAAIQGTDPGTGTGFGGELGQTQDEQMQVDEPDARETPAQRAAREDAEELADTGMTDAERARLDDIRARKALARLTEGFGDDTAAQQEEVGFLEQILGAVRSEPARGGSPVIADIADQIHQAKENLRSLTTGGSSNNDSDLQAQIDQQRQRAENAEANYRTSQRELATLGGPGDIGTGRGGALGMGARFAPAMVQNNYMLHPADPSVMRTIGDAAVAGIGYQGGRPSPRQTVGVR